jgi:hypothetical protein
MGYYLPRICPETPRRAGSSSSRTAASTPCYRIQVYFGSERAKAFEMRTEFLKRYPDIAADVQYRQPNFKTRVGNFRDRMQAKKFLKEIVPVFPAAFIVKDEIALP